MIIIETVNKKVLDSEPIVNTGTIQNSDINWLTFFSVVNQNVTMQEPDDINAFHPKFEGQSMKLELQDIREEVYFKYNPFDESYKPGTEEHMNYTNTYFNEKK